jgi:hypothetical protein
MKISKVEEKRFVMKRAFYHYDRDGRISQAIKTKPLRTNDDDRLYKLHQHTKLTFDNDDLEKINEYAKENNIQTYSTDVSDSALIGYIRKTLNNNDIGFYDISYCYGWRIPYHIMKAKNDKQKVEFDINVVIFSEDGELITTYTKKELRMREQRKEAEVKTQVYRSFILPTLQSALAEFGIRPYDDGVNITVCEYSEKFIKVAIKKLVLPRIESLGLDIEPLRKIVDETDTKVIRFKPTDFKIKE